MAYRRRRKKRNQPYLEVTLTPLIDTALTLLIIFMVTTPMIQNAIKIDLPKGQAKEGGSEQQELVVSIDKDEKLFFNNKPISLDQLGQTIKTQMAAQNQKQERRVWVKIDRSKSCSANILISTIDRIKVLGGVKDVAIATEAVSS